MSLLKEKQRILGLWLCKKYNAPITQKCIENKECHKSILSTFCEELSVATLILIIKTHDEIRNRWAYHTLLSVTIVTKKEHVDLVNIIDDAEWAHYALIYIENLSKEERSILIARINKVQLAKLTLIYLKNITENERVALQKVIDGAEAAT